MTTPTKAVAVSTPGQHVIARPGEWNREIAKVVKESIAPGLNGQQLLVYSKICQATGLDPFKKQIYAWPDKGRMAIHIGINGWRAIAARTGEYGGQTQPEWCGPDGAWRDVWLEDVPPAACRVGVYRTGSAQPTYAVVTWKEFERTQKRTGARGATQWDDRPAHMLQVRAEAFALQKACPGAYDEAIGVVKEAKFEVEITAGDDSDVPAEIQAAVAHAIAAPADPETGEILDGEMRDLEPQAEATPPPSEPEPPTRTKRASDKADWWDQFSDEMVQAGVKPDAIVAAGKLSAFTKPAVEEWMQRTTLSWADLLVQAQSGAEQAQLV